MKLQTGIAVILSLICFLTGCAANNGSTPDIQNVQSSQQAQDTAKMDRAIYQ